VGCGGDRFLGCGRAIAFLGCWRCDRFDNEDFGGAIAFWDVGVRSLFIE